MYVGSCPYGADKITQNIAVTYNLSEREAEKIKCELGFAVSNSIISGKEIRIENRAAQIKSINQGELAESIEAGYNQLILKVLTKLNEVNDSADISLGAGFVICGGAAETKCLQECVAKIFNNNGLGGYARKIRIHQVDKRMINGLTDAISPYSGSASLGLIKFSDILESHKKNRNYKGIIKVFHKIADWCGNNM